MPFDATHQPTNVQLLIKAQSVIDQPYLWTKCHYQQTVFGYTQHCLVAALGVACNNADFRYPTNRERDLAKLLVREMSHGWCLPAIARVRFFNDNSNTTHADIMALFKRAIDRQMAQANYV